MGKKFDSTGLRHSMSHLKEVGRSVVLLSLGEIADYVDGVTKERVDSGDPDFLARQVLAVDPETIEFDRFNATSFGNVAYVALHCKSTQGKQIAARIIERAKKEISKYSA